MLDLSLEFSTFSDSITLTSSKKDKIRTSRDAVRSKIKNHFSEKLGIAKPKFAMQGSFVINTIIDPLDEEEVDIDDGIYLQHIAPNDTWPTPTKAHTLILDALENHTHDGCESKTSCVRVYYRNFYHLDLPVYIMKDDKAHLGQTKSDEWLVSDSKSFKDWFNSKKESTQINRITKYIKAWRDFKKLDFSSIELTILVAESIKYSELRDDISLLSTMKNILTRVRKDREVIKPVAPGENLWSELTTNAIDSRIERLSNFLEDLEEASNNASKYRATLILRELFGDRFPLSEEGKPTSVKEFSSGARPWRV